MKKRKLRRLGILVVVLVLLFNTLGARASTNEVTVSTYEELVEAIKQADDMDVITINSIIVIPKGSTLGNSSKRVIIKYGGRAYIECELDINCSTTTTFENLIFDGEGKVSDRPLVLARGKVEFINCTFQRANYGAVRTAYTQCSFTDCTFSNNTGKYYGGHINASTQSVITVDNCTFSYGISSSRGGAIHIDDTSSSIHIKNSKISANESGLGGGISCSGSLILEDTVIYNNHATTGGADLFIIGSYQMQSIEEMAEAYHVEGLEPISWESDYTDLDYGGTCLKLNYEAYVPPVEPEDPSEEDPSQPTKPEETDPEPTDPVTPPEETDPSTGEDGETDPPSTGGDETEDPTTTPSEEDPTEPQEPEGTEKPEDEDKPPTTATPSDADEAGGGNTDNSSTDNSDNSTTDNSTVDNSQTNTDNSQSNSSSSSVVDNSSHESNDNSSYREDNSYRDSSSTVNYYYQQESPIQESPTASQNGSQPINITVPVEISTQQGETASMGSTGAPEGDHITTAPQQNIKIEAEGVDLVYEYTEGGISISISSPEAPESPTEAIEVNSPTPIIETPQEADKSPNWVECGSLILLAALVGLEVKDRWKNKA